MPHNATIYYWGGGGGWGFNSEAWDSICIYIYTHKFLGYMYILYVHTITYVRFAWGYRGHGSRLLGFKVSIGSIRAQ